MTKHVAAAVIFDMDENNNKRVFAAKKQNGFWEFPGGKLEPNEPPAHTAVREIKEELDMDIVVDEFIATITVNQGDDEIILDAFACHMTNNTFILKEHVNFRWLTEDDLRKTRLNWYQSDKLLIEYMLNDMTIECY